MSEPDRLKATIELQCPIVETPRVKQLSGLFDIPPLGQSRLCLQIDVSLPAVWNVGLIVGPSGCGKSTLARRLWADRIAPSYSWPSEKSIVDGFPAGMSIKDVTYLLCSVGFSSPPSWLKPFGILSTGEQFRVGVARALAENPDLAVIDEFSSVVDRQVAKIASAAIQKAVRRRQKFVAVTCHYDVAEWLEPDWIYYPQTGEFVAGRSLRRPQIELEIARVHREAWKLFGTHHYLNAGLHSSAKCFVGFVDDQPATFTAVLPFPHARRPGYREHRTVCLPDYQGIGIGLAMSAYIGSLFVASGKPYYSTTSHPGLIRHRLASPLWKCTRLPSRTDAKSNSQLNRSWKRTLACNRLTAGFRYVGPARPAEARAFGLPNRAP